MRRPVARHHGVRLTLALLLAVFTWSTAAESVADTQLATGHHSVAVSLQAGAATTVATPQRHVGGIVLHAVRSRSIATPSTHAASPVGRGAARAQSTSGGIVRSRAPPH